MTKQERLALYKAALKDYKNKGDKNTHAGFCCYFLLIHQVEVYEVSNSFKLFPKRLPELFKQKPKDILFTQTPWWPNGAKAPRIKALKAAIKIIEDESSTD